jgi:peptide-methionine (S)-S-oxide reductase
MIKTILLSVIFSTLTLSACLQTPDKSKTMSYDKPMNELQDTNYQTATFGAGCFWCVEAIFQELKGVHRVESGFSGGHIKNPSYREVVTGNTGHAEVARIIFDPEVISFEELLEVFWTTHDPTTLNRQGNDIGTQYRSAIFYHDEEQKNIAEKSKNEVATQIWDDPIVTEITEFEAFYPAENYHQDYFNLNPNQGYCRVVIAPKVKKFREKYATKLK